MTRSSTPARRRLAVGIAALALVPIGILAGCGNGAVKQRDDTRPEPNATTEGVQSIYPTALPPTPQSTYQVPRSGPPSPGLTP